MGSFDGYLSRTANTKPAGQGNFSGYLQRAAAGQKPAPYQPPVAAAPVPQPTFFQNVLSGISNASQATGAAVSKVPLVGSYLAYLGSGYGQAVKNLIQTGDIRQQADAGSPSVGAIARQFFNPKTIEQTATDFVAPNVKKYAQDIVERAVAPQYAQQNTEALDRRNQLNTVLNNKILAESDKTKRQALLNLYKKINAQPAGIVDINQVLPTLTKSNKQLLGDVVGTGFDIGTAVAGGKIVESGLKGGQTGLRALLTKQGIQRAAPAIATQSFLGAGQMGSQAAGSGASNADILKNAATGAITYPIMATAAEAGGNVLSNLFDRTLSKGTAGKISGDLVKEAETVPSQAQEQVKSTSQQIAESKSQSEISDILKSVGIDRPSVAKDLINEKRPSVIANRIKQEITRKESSGSKIIESFSKSKDQKVIGQVNGRDIELGTFGKEQTASKTSKFQPDRFPESELKTTLDHVIKETKADNGSKGYREANTALIAKMPDGETRVIYTRPNAAGKDEIINWHSVDETKNPNYVKTLESFGAPSRIRTGAIPLEEGRSSPLAYGGTESISEPKKEIQPQTEKVTVPRSQVPVGGSGETKVSRLAARVSDKLGAITPEERAKLPEYEAMTHKDQLQKAAAFVESNPKDALAVLRGDKPAPEGLLHGSIFLAAEQKAIDSGDATLIRDLASLRATRAGQELSILAARDPNSPVKYLDEVKQARYEIRGGEEKVKKQIKQTVKEGMDVIKKSAPKAKDWASFLDEIRCA